MNEEVLKDIAYNLRRLVLLQGGGRWLGTKSLELEPKEEITIYFQDAQSSILVVVSNASLTEDILLSTDITVFKDPVKINKLTRVLKPGVQFKVLLEYKEGLYAYNPGNLPAIIEVDYYVSRDCNFYG